MSPIEEMELDDAQKDGSLHLKYQHTFYHVLHGMEGFCPVLKDRSNEKFSEEYDEQFAIGLEMLLNKTRENEVNEMQKINYKSYIYDHFKNFCECSPCCAKLWKYCFDKKDYNVLRYAKEGLVVSSKLNEDLIGKITAKYPEYTSVEKVIGYGGFGRVYRLSKKLVVKEECKRPLIFSNPTVFQLVVKLNCKHVISLEEYVVGRFQDNNPDRRVFLSVMPYQNRRGLNEQFLHYSCILDHMIEFEDQQQLIFRNYIVMFTHMFKGLEYLHGKNIIHGDIKDQNILVHQSCPCKSPLQCSCDGGSGVTYVLGDMSLFWKEREQRTSKYIEWATAKCKEPAGTKGMKAPELYFTGTQGEKCGGTEADIWAGCVTMMKVLVGDEKIRWSEKQIEDFFKAISHHSSKHVRSIENACKTAEELKTEITAFEWNQENLKVKEFTDKLNKVIQSLESVNRTHWMSSYTYPEKLPVPFLLGVAHEANSLHQQCLNKLPTIYSTPTWEAMEEIKCIIKNGLKLLPENRSSASKIIKELEALSIK